MKAKEWLKQNGFIAEIGRGRISFENHKRLAESGLEFSDWNDRKVAVMVVEDDKGTEIVTAHRVDEYHTNGGYGPDGAPVKVAPYRYTEAEFRAVQADGTVRSLREVCEHCGVSLVQCYCGHPSIVATNGQGHVSVSIVAGGRPVRKGNIWDK